MIKQAAKPTVLL